MTAIDNLLEVLKENANQKLTTEEIAQKIGLSRSVVSGYLAKLFKKDLVEKSSGRPVYWQVKAPKSPFSDLIGYNDSLKLSVEKAKQSIVYPPNGFPVIITGPSGVGKSFLARKIYEEAIYLGKINSHSPFVTLNTADYANNNNLLSSVLFGYKKGAFTGAEKDTLGLLDKANNGYLFLDEVHRLSKTNQEKLFSVFDSGTFYPLGEVNTPHHVNVRLIFATTENLSKYLLKTFLRRIPMKIELPSFKARPLYERVQIVLYCLKNEAKKANATYLISPDKINEIAIQDYPGNIGRVANNIEMLCSKGFTENEGKKEVPLGLEGSYPNAIKIDKNSNVNGLQMLDKVNFNELEETQNKLIAAIEQNKSLNDCQLIDFRVLRKIKKYSDPTVNKILTPHLEQIIKSTIKGIYGIDLNLDKDAFKLLTLAFAFGKFQRKPLKNTNKFLHLVKRKYGFRSRIWTHFMYNLSD